MPRRVTVTAASRLHFGLFALRAPTGVTERRSYGGVGVMISQPGISLVARDSDAFRVSAGPLAERLKNFARRWAEFYSQPLDDVELAETSHTPDHVGLGTGTQLGLAVAACLSAFHGWPVPPVEELARSVGRGLRSAVGAYGFTLGGLIVDRGKLPDEPLAPLDCRLELPAEWRFVLVRPLQAAGLAGECEQRAMEIANRNLEPLTEQLVTEARESLIPAAATADFAAFAHSLGRYCELAGQFYLGIQGGPFNGPLVTALAHKIRRLGHVGMGQSSWGPTLFVACKNEASAQSLLHALQADVAGCEDIEVTITGICNEPARIEVVPDAASIGNEVPN